MKFLFTIIIITLSYSQNLDRYKRNVTYLSSDELEGRHYRSDGLRKAAKYVENEFRVIGVQPLFSRGYIQSDKFYDKPVHNVVAYIPSKKKSDKSIIFSAHLDGLGIGEPNANKDSIYNGAVDNAVGVAAIIEFAAYFIKHQYNDINLIFVTTSPEEAGLEGGQYFLRKYPFPKDEILMVFNNDGFNIQGPMRNYTIMPMSGVSFSETISELIIKQGFKIYTPNWIEYMNNKFDTSTFLIEGIPAVTIWAGNHLAGMTLEESKIMNVFGERHHSPDDEVADNWNWDGVTEHFQLMLKIVDFYAKSGKKESVLDISLFE